MFTYTGNGEYIRISWYHRILVNAETFCRAYRSRHTLEIRRFQYNVQAKVHMSITQLDAR